MFHSWRRLGRRRAGSRCSAQIPGASHRGYNPAGFSRPMRYEISKRPLACSSLASPSPVVWRNIGASRLITSSRGWLNSGSNCPPCEDDAGILTQVLRCWIDWNLSNISERGVDRQALLRRRCERDLPVAPEGIEAFKRFERNRVGIRCDRDEGHAESVVGWARLAADRCR
jgi:hypothetical protein